MVAALEPQVSLTDVISSTSPNNHQHHSSYKPAYNIQPRRSGETKHSPDHQLITPIPRVSPSPLRFITAPPHHETPLSNTTNHLPALVGPERWIERCIRKDETKIDFTGRHYGYTASRSISGLVNRSDVASAYDGYAPIRGHVQVHRCGTYIPSYNRSQHYMRKKQSEKRNVLTVMSRI